MTSTKLLTRIQSWGLRLAEREGRLIIYGRPTQQARLLIAAHQDALLATLRGEDVPLTLGQTKAHLESLGLVQLETGDWTHPLGDDHAEAVLCGDISREDAEDAHEVRTARMAREAAGLTPMSPRASVLEDAPTLHPVPRTPGQFTFTKIKGRRYRPFPFEKERRS